ncbi:hypothetical protein HRTV-25_gp89 [Halorubrum tailed virus 25]|uniref:Uncharacterized protein n=1 Tax=Halorubrum tailed virus 25 TaxID=2878006 RepID=A0AAE8XY92_9CAUD|nr:hypothetical protein M1M37_gp089 [Halorubrum tailed virus 25]UBF22670.1 hypothetical protein HRTV-25_gp89 [Halorubrum tailed virus 25]
MWNKDNPPECIACGEKWVYSICLNCTLPETEWEDHNRNVATKSHNNYNYHFW